MMEEPMFRSNDTQPGGALFSATPAFQSIDNQEGDNSEGDDAGTSIQHSTTPPPTADNDHAGVAIEKGKSKEVSPVLEGESSPSRKASFDSKRGRSPRGSPIKGNTPLRGSPTKSGSILPPPEVPPKSPRHTPYSLPIGGGPKKVFVVSGGRRQQSSSSTRFVSASSSKGKLSGPAPSVPSIPEAHKEAFASSPKKDRPSSAPAQPVKSMQRSSSTRKTSALGLINDQPLSPSEASLGRRRTLSTSNTTLEAKQLTESSNSLLRARSSTTLEGGKTTRPPNAPILQTNTLDLTGSPRRRLTASSVLMVEGQMFEINDADEDEKKAEKPLPSPLPALEENNTKGNDTIGTDGDTTFPFSEMDDGDQGSVHDEPMIYTDDEIDDVPPPGAYAIHPPSKTRLARAADLPLYDEDGNIVEFGSIFETRRTLVCFLRHWLCPFCQMFSQSLQHIDPLPLEKAELDLVVVGQGHWHVTKSYKEVMKIPKFVKMYSDPSRKIYKALGMTLRTNDAGPACARPDYQTMGVFKASMVAIKKGVIDMPLRPPGDLMLLGGEFILGPGLHCSFTHRMVTTRGHLDLPRILVQAGCDLSLKTPVDPNASPRRPISTKSLDRSNARRLARKFGKNRGKPRDSQNEAIIQRLAGDQSQTLRALSGEHKTMPRSIGKKRNPPLPNIRNIKISHPMDQSPARMSESGVDSVPSSPEYYRQYPISRRQRETSPLRNVKDKLADGMVNGFSKSQSMGDMNLVFTRPPRSAHRPPVPATSSAIAFAAASARASDYRSQPNSPTKGRFTSPSMPSMINRSTTSVQTLQPQQHWQTISNSTTADSSYSSRHKPSYSANSLSSDQSLHSIINRESPLTSITHSNSLKRVNQPKPISELEASRAATFSSSSPSLPLSTGFPDPSRSKKSSVRSISPDFGEDTEYKRLDKKIFEQPTLLLNGHANDSDEERDVPLSVSDLQEDEEGGDWSPYRMAAELPSLNGHRQEASGLTAEEEDDLQKTPLARKISLELGDDILYQQRGNNRSSIMVGNGVHTVGGYPHSYSSTSTPMMSPTSATFAQNALLAGLPSYNNPPSSLPSSRAPVSAPAPLFAALLAEEAAARSSSDGHQSNGNAGESSMKLAQKSPKSPRRGANLNRVPKGSSFLDDMEVHDSFVRREATSDSIDNSKSSGGNSVYESDYFEEEEEEEEEEDDWAPLQASGNVVPARLSSEVEDDASGDEDVSRTESSSRSFDEGDEDDSMYDDEDDLDRDQDSMRRNTIPSPSQEYELKKVTGRVTARPSTAPVVSIPRKIKATPGQSIYNQSSLTGLRLSSRRLDSFREEEEEEESSA